MRRVGKKMDMFVEFLGYLLTGAVAGTLAGLFGVGGGLIIVPALIFAFGWLALSPEIATHLAVGTSLATIIPTGISSTLGHHKNKAVVWSAFRSLAPGVVIGTWLGVITAIHLSGNALQMLIGTGAIMIGLKLWFSKKNDDKAEPALPDTPVMLAGGGVIGYISAIFGIGGGTLTVPFLNKYGIRMQKAVGTSAACGLPIAVMGALANIVLGEVVLGAETTSLPAYSTGLVYWPAFAGIVLMSVPFARVGARLAHKLPADVLRRLFACLLFSVGLKFIIGN